MKKLYTFGPLLLAFGLMAPTIAQGVVTANIGADVEATVNVVPARTNVKADVRASTTTEIQNIRAAMTEQIHDARGQFRAEVAKIRVVSATRVIGATINRLQKIITRIESRITKVKAAGGTTDSAQASVDTAQVSLTDAQVQLNAILGIDLSTTSTTTAAANFETIKTDAAKARQDLEAARQNLLKAVINLAQVEKVHPGVEASTSADVSVN